MLVVLSLDGEFVGVGGAEVGECVGDEPASVGVAGAREGAVKAAQTLDVARIGAHASRELVGRFFGRLDGRRRHLGKIDLDGFSLVGLLELPLELRDALRELGHLQLQGQHRRILRGFGPDDDRGCRRFLIRHLANPHVVARLVGGLEGLLEFAKALAIEPECVRRLVEARSLLERDDAVLDDLREDLLVVNFEFAELEVAGELALLERSFVLERELLRRHASLPLRRRRALKARSYSRRRQEAAKGPAPGAPCR